MDRYEIDSHKLIYHVARVHDWLAGKLIYPIYMEISPAGSCNHRCTYCGLDFMEYQPRYLDTGLLKERVSELAGLGIKSIMYAGEGEPLLHRQMSEIITHTKKAGIDAALTTNGVLFKKDSIDNILADTEWIKVSIDAATKATYAKIHRCRPIDFERVMDNLSSAVKLKRKNRYRCTLGMQFLLLPDNYREAVGLAKIARDIGLNYLVIKPYSQHLQSKTKKYSSIKYGKYEYLAEELAKLNTDNFSVVFRMQTMRQWDKRKREYSRCFALPFWSYIDAGGNVWGCSVYLGREQFLYGNIYEQSFREIWNGAKRLRSLRWSEEKLDASRCRLNCRMDKINQYLWELRNHPAHVNFI